MANADMRAVPYMMAALLVNGVIVFRCIRLAAPDSRNRIWLPSADFAHDSRSFRRCYWRNRILAWRPNPNSPYPLTFFLRWAVGASFLFGNTMPPRQDAQRRGMEML